MKTDPDSFFDLSVSLIIVPVYYFCLLQINDMVSLMGMICLPLINSLMVSSPSPVTSEGQGHSLMMVLNETITVRENSYWDLHKGILWINMIFYSDEPIQWAKILFLLCLFLLGFEQRNSLD